MDRGYSDAALCMPVDTYASYVFVFLHDKSKKTEPTVTKFGARDDL